ncbi:MAG: Xaa-Pro dipeptidase [Acidobacteriota bacterium]
MSDHTATAAQNSSAASLESLYRRHLEQMDGWLADAIERAGARGVAVDGVLFHAGRPREYHRDDRVVVFRPTAHYRRWVPPQGGPEHVVAARPGRTPVVVRVIPKDFWYDNTPPETSHWEEAVELLEVASPGEVRGALESVLAGATWAYFGDSPEAAAELGVDAELIEPDALRMPLDWSRATKTDYEVALSREACAAGARGHLAAREGLEQGWSELEVHLAFLRAARCPEERLPFDSIVALNEKSAILHYQNKRLEPPESSQVLLVDSGADFCGYASDVTRTWVSHDAPDTFRSLVAAVDTMERQLVAMVAPGRSYVEIHLECHRQTAEILKAHDLITCSPEEAVATRLTRTFMPHGVGHQLGLQVHDVGGQQSAADGGQTPPPDEHVLRNTRTLSAGHLVTIEPGFYFIPMLLDAVRAGEQSSHVNWTLVDALTPCGGIRIEDDVLCTPDGYEDLTRGLIQPVEA